MRSSSRLQIEFVLILNGHAKASGMWIDFFSPCPFEKKQGSFSFLSQINEQEDSAL